MAKLYNQEFAVEKVYQSKNGEYYLVNECIGVETKVKTRAEQGSEGIDERGDFHYNGVNRIHT